MKKIQVLTLVLLAFAGSAFAAPLATHTPTTGGAKSVYGGNSPASALAATTPLIKFSTGVNGLVNFTASAGTSTGYVVATKHTTGSKVFGTANDSTNIYWKQSPAATLADTDIGAGTTTTTVFGAGLGWTSY